MGYWRFFYFNQDLLLMQLLCCPKAGVLGSETASIWRENLT
jgi:hypothetical protein